MEKVTFTLTPDLSEIPSSDRSKALKEIGQYLVEAILADVGETRSPVTGRMFKKLSADYAEKKAEESSSPVANLELSGDMLDSLDFKVVGNKVEVGIWGDEADKADGHCNHSGKSDLPERRFIPVKGENFRPDIRSEVENILSSYADEKAKVRR
jgi:hypothetical protein